MRAVRDGYFPAGTLLIGLAAPMRYAHLSPGYLTGAAGKLDNVFASVLPLRVHKNGGSLVPRASPLLEAPVAS